MAVEDGTVTLTGTVGSAAELTRARQAGFVSGVTDVDTTGLTVAFWSRHDDLRGGKYVHRSDSAIADAIEDALIFDPRVMSTNVMPEVRSGVVTLRGTVLNAGAQRAAVAAARNTVGVWHVRDHLKVRPSASVDDATVAINARDAVARDPFLDGDEIRVQVIAGVAMLDGTVDTAFEKRQAENVVSDLKGVIAVRNRLDVGDPSSRLWSRRYLEPYLPEDYAWYRAPAWTTASDWQIAENVRNELWWSPFVDSDDVTVMVSDGVATLTGTVSTWNERRAASENAIEGGAVSVRNELKVDEGLPAPPSPR